MGFMKHDSIIITCFSKELIEKAYNKSISIFSQNNVSDIMVSNINEYYSFFIPPDGSKEGWPESDLGDHKRKIIINWLNKQRYEDGSTPYSWVCVQYGSDDKKTKIINHSDE